jgi:hypothetical protein
MIRLVLIFIFLVYSTVTFAQAGRDTTVSKSLLDSLHYRIYQLTDSTRRLSYYNHVLANVFRIDTIKSRFDSTTLNYYSKSGQLLKRVILERFKRADCISLEKAEYFNRRQESEFIEYWEHTCLTDEEKASKELFEKVHYTYERLEYDTMGRVSALVYCRPEMLGKFMRLEYAYDENGKREIVNKGTVIDFWNE